MLTEGLGNDLSQLLVDLADSCDQMGRDLESDESTAKRLAHLAAVARAEAGNVEKPFRLGVVGMFKSGKSSVLNTFLRRKVLQEGRTETTSVLTELRFAESPDEEKGLVEFDGDRFEERSIEEALAFTDIRSAVFQDLPEEGKRKLQESIRQITLFLHCDLLRTLTLLDTPGFGGSAIGDRKAFDALREVDAALMVFSADRVGTQDELEVADALSRADREIVALLNKVDDGRGGALTEQQLEAPESFLRENFRTLVRGADGQPLVFRYSALEVWKALEILKKPNLSRDEGKAAVEALEGWGFRGHGEEERERGVIEFLRSRYFASDQDAHRRKLEQAEGSVRNAAEELKGGLEDVLAKVAERLEGLEVERTDAERHQEQRLEGKIAQIETEIGEVIDDLLGPFSLRLEEALEQIIDSRTDFDLADLIKMAQSTDELAEQVKEEFEQEFPSWETEAFVEDLQHRLHRLMKREWKLLVHELETLDHSVELPDVAEILEDVNLAIRNFGLAMAAYLLGEVALLFIPGGQIVAAIQLLALGAGLYQTQKHKRAIKDAKRKSKAQVRAHARKMRHELLSQALEANQRMAEEARSVLWKQVEKLDQEEMSLRQQREQLRKVRRHVDGYLDVLEDEQDGLSEASRAS